MVSEGVASPAGSAGGVQGGSGEGLADSLLAQLHGEDGASAETLGRRAGSPGRETASAGDLCRPEHSFQQRLMSLTQCRFRKRKGATWLP